MNKNQTAELLREPHRPSFIDTLLPMTEDEFAERYLAPALAHAEDEFARKYGCPSHAYDPRQAK